MPGNPQSPPGTAQSSPFSDVSETDWYYEAVQNAYRNGLFSGTGGGAFSPLTPMTRAMFVTVLGRMAGINPADYSGNGGFADIDPQSWHAPFIVWAVRHGIIKGVGGNRFSPQLLTNREQMAVMTVRFFEAHHIPYEASQEDKPLPRDMETVSSWAQDAMRKLWQAGLLRGDANGNLNPRQPATRAEAATLSTRSHEVVSTVLREFGFTSLTDALPTLYEAALSSAPTPSPTPSPTNSASSDSTVYHTVSFQTNGGSSISPVSVRDGGTLSQLPTPQKDHAIFVGWYADAERQTQPFTADSQVLRNLILYADYLAIEDPAIQETPESFTLLDQEPGFVLTLLSSSPAMTSNEVLAGLSLEVMDGTATIPLSVNGTNGAYAVSAVGGFTAGASYQLTLTDDRLAFSTQETVRICAFTIRQDEVADLILQPGMQYIPKSDVANIVKDGAQVDAFSVPVMVLSAEEDAPDAITSGTFDYTGGKVLQVGDVLCIYSGVQPQPENADAIRNDEIAYVKVTGVVNNGSGHTISYVNAEPEDVLFLPDVLPVYVGEGNTLTDHLQDGPSGSFSTTLFDLHLDAYEAVFGVNGDTTVDVGDYLYLTAVDLLLLDADSNGRLEEDEITEGAISEEDIAYAVVTGVTLSGSSLHVTYDLTTRQEMQDTSRYHAVQDLDGAELLEGVDVSAFQAQVENQVYASGFAQEAALYLTSMAMATDGFEEVAGSTGNLASFSLSMEDGSSIPVDQVSAMAEEKKVRIENLKVKATVNQQTRQFNSGVRCAIEVSFNIRMTAGDGQEIVVVLSATFIEEIKLTVSTSGSAIWKQNAWYLPPYIDDYHVNAGIDLYDYTAIQFKAVVSSQGDVKSVDVSEQIQKLMGSSKKDEITAGVRKLYDLYAGMMDNETDWLELFSQRIVDIPIALLFGAVQLRVTADFVVSVNINVAIGCNFEYKNGTRYNFWVRVKARTAGSSSMSLLEDTYDFQFYVMGVLGLRAGIRLEVAIGLFSLHLNSVGLSAEAGVFTRLYGFFLYERNRVGQQVGARQSGALYMDLGAYLEIAFKAQVLNGKYMYNPTLYEKEWTFLHAGQRYAVFDFETVQADPIVLNDQSTGYTLPAETFGMIYLDLREGEVDTRVYDMGQYLIRFSDPRFSLSGNRVVANVPASIKYLRAEMTVIWKASPLAFSSVPISRTYPLVWDNLDKNGYTITYASNGGSPVPAVTKPYGAVLSAPTPPVRTGYTFAGWFADAGLTQPFTFTTMGWNHVTVYAKWTPNTNTRYLVEHAQEDLAGGRFVRVAAETFTGTTGTSVTPAVKAYAGFTAPATRTVTIAADGSTVVEYRYTRRSFSLTFVANNGKGDVTRSLKYGAAITPPSLTKTGHVFKGWTPIPVSTMPANAVSYTATWQANTYPVSFNGNGGTNPTGITVTFGSTYGALPVPVRAGYTFAGWYTGISGDVALGTQITSDTTVQITAPQLLHAKWTGQSGIGYTVRHHQQNPAGTGYVVFETETPTGTAGTEVSPAVKTYAGFHSPNGKTVTLKGDGTTVVDYHYTRNRYSLTLVLGNGEENRVLTYRFGEPITAPTISRTGYSFKQWEPEMPATMPDGNLTATAIWIDHATIPYTVRHYQESLEEGVYALSETENKTGVYGVPFVPDRKAYVGFTTPEEQSVQLELDGTTVVDYHYTRNSYQLTFHAAGGTSGSTASVKYGAAISPPETDPVRDGYTFAGWTPAPAVTMPAQDTTYTAGWLANAYAISFDSNGGTAFDTRSLTFGLPYGELPVPTREGFFFNGWYDTETDGNGMGSHVTADTVMSTAAAHTLYAKWTAGTPEEQAAETAVATAESSKTHADVKTATDLVNALDNLTVKAALGERLRAIVVVYELSLNAGDVSIYSNRVVHGGTTLTHLTDACRYIITGTRTSDTPLRVWHDAAGSLTYDITLKNASILGSMWATATRFDYEVTAGRTADEFVVNLHIEGTVISEGYSHAGFYANAPMTVNLTGAAGATLRSHQVVQEPRVALGNAITVSFDAANIASMKVAGVETANIQDARSASPLEITFK